MKQLRPIQGAMEVAAMSAEVFLKVDAAKVIKHTPQMFVSFEEACTEAVQNAYRAGATQIEFRVDKNAAVVEIRDDGPGIQDPDSLLTIGRSDWEREVVEPAGMGFMALAGLSDEIIVESRTADGRSWRLTIPHKAFAGAAAALEDIEPDDTHGVFIRAKLDLHRAVLQLPDSFRHRYPLAVQVTIVEDGKENRRDLPAPATQEAINTLDGRLAKGTDWGLRFVWEHRNLTAEDGMADLWAALREIPHGKHVKFLLSTRNKGLTLELSSDSEVRPQLPDRRAVIKNWAYYRAVAGVVRTLERLLDVDGLRKRVEALGLPGVIAWHDLHLRGLPEAAAMHPLLDAGSAANTEVALRVCGYRHVSWTDLSSTDFWSNDDEHGFEYNQRIVWAKAPLLSKNNALASALSRSGLLTAVSADAQDLHVRATGAVLTTYEDLPRFGVAKSIEVLSANGKTVLGTLSRLVSGDAIPVEIDGREFIGAIYLQVAKPINALKTIRANIFEVGGCVMQWLDSGEVDEGSIWDYIEDEEIEYDRILDDVVKAFTRDVLPDLHRAETRYMAVRDASFGMGGIATQIKATVEKLKKVVAEFPETEPDLGPKIQVLEAFAPSANLDIKAWESGE